MSENNVFEEYAQLVKRYREGDADAFEAIYERSSRFVYATCLGVLGDPEDAKDAMQETYVSVFNNLDSLTDGKNLLGWIKRIAVNKSTDMIRKKKGETYYDDAVASEEILEGNDNLEDLPDHFIMEKSKRDALHGLIKQELSDVQYQTVFLHYFDEMSVEDISSVMACPEGTVKTRLKSARILIRKAIEKYEKETGDILHAAGTVPLLPGLFKAAAGDLSVPDVTSFIKTGLASAAEAGASAAGHAGGAAAKAAAVKAGSTGATGAAAAAKAGLLSTGIGKAIAAGIAALVLVPAGFGAKYILGKTMEVKDVDGTEITEEETAEVVIIESQPETTAETSSEPVIEITEITETSETTEPKTDESLPEPLVTETQLPERINVPLEELPDYDSLRSFISRWSCHEYDHETIEDAFVVNRMLTSESGVLVNFGNYFEDYDENFGYEDPGAIFSASGIPCFRLAEDELVWVESNILNISDEDISRINGNIAVVEGDYPYGAYCSNGYVWYTRGFAGNTLCETILSAETDGQYYYLTSVLYDDLAVENNPAYVPARDGMRFDYVMEYREIDGANYWTILSCGPSDSEYSGAGELAAFLPEAYSLPDTGWKAAYIEIVQSLTPQDFDNGYNEGSYRELVCDLVLINDDDIPELIVSVDVGGGVRYGKLYTFVNGEALFLRSLYGYEQVYNTYRPRANCVLTGGGVEQNGGYFSTFVSHMTDDCMSMEHVSFARANFDMVAYENVLEDPNANNGTVRYYTYDSDYRPVEISQEEYDSRHPGDDAERLEGTMTVDTFVEALQG